MSQPLRHIATEPGNLNMAPSTPVAAAPAEEHDTGAGRPAAYRTRSHTQSADLTNSMNYLRQSPPTLTRSTNNLNNNNDDKPVADRMASKGSFNSMPARLATSGTSMPSGASTGRKKTKHLDLNAEGLQWEIIEGLRSGQEYEGDDPPQKFEGFLFKKRKRPLKGWHKRYFVLENGYLVYGKKPSDLARGKVTDAIDVGMSVVSTRNVGLRVDLDNDESIHHLKSKNADAYEEWRSHLRQHRLYRQHVISLGVTSSAKAVGGEYALSRTMRSEFARKKQSSSDLPGADDAIQSKQKTAEWLSNANQDQFNKDLAVIQEQMLQLSDLLKKLEHLEHAMGSADNLQVDNQEGRGIKKFFKKITRQKKSPAAGTSDPESQPVSEAASSSLESTQAEAMPRTFSESKLTNKTVDSRTQESSSCLLEAPDALSTAEQRSIARQEALRAEYLALSRDTYATFVRLQRSMQAERDKLRGKAGQEGNGIIYDWDEQGGRPMKRSFSYGGTSVVSGVYYDALDSDKMSKSDDEELLEDDEDNMASDISEVTGASITGKGLWRRTRLPAPKPDVGDFSLWGILRKNIGKDLSKISMPVSLNEPLSVLQRLGEEMEYVELLDKASELDDPLERMIYVSAFAVSAYGASHYRSGQKPFNPMLGETFDMVREDKGFTFHSEQVSHHPPVGAAYTESKNYNLCQDIRVKTTFWGKSMEIFPSGNLTLIFPKYNATYTWNKVTSCIHNLFSGVRWADMYGVLTVTDGEGNICKMNFLKSPSYENRKNEFKGTINNSSGKTVHNVFGRWHEAFYCGVAPSARVIWRMGTMPDDKDLYYGFTRYAIELNELTEDDERTLPPTDSRFRGDQRAMENGDIVKADEIKLALEVAQRVRRTEREAAGGHFEPFWFTQSINPKDKSEVWSSNGKYWAAKQSGFAGMEFELNLRDFVMPETPIEAPPP